MNTVTNTATQANPTHLIKEVLSRNPRASIHQIRDAHPIFRTMSLDQVGLRLSHLLERCSDGGLK